MRERTWMRKRSGRRNRRKVEKTKLLYKVIDSGKRVLSSSML